MYKTHKPPTWNLEKLSETWNSFEVVRISYDKVVSHLFIDSMSLVIHKFDLLRSLKITDSFKHFLK